MIRNTLLELGVAPHHSGYEYLIQAVALVEENPKCIKAVTKEIYPEVAKRCYATSSRVERAIRHAVEHAFLVMPDDIRAKVFGNTVSPDTGKVTNSHFIAAVTQYVISKEKEAQIV